MPHPGLKVATGKCCALSLKNSPSQRNQYEGSVDKNETCFLFLPKYTLFLTPQHENNFMLEKISPANKRIWYGYKYLDDCLYICFDS